MTVLKMILPALGILAVSLASAVIADDYALGERLAPVDRDAPATYPEVEWDDLMPAGWDPLEAFKGLDLDTLDDSDPRAIEALAKVRELWDAAPANDELDGRTGRIAGFLVPLDWDAREFREFLLVPYFGACIHLPPPPANQIIHVFADPPVRELEIMDAVWVEGRFEIADSDTEMGRSGYRMEASNVTRYDW